MARKDGRLRPFFRALQQRQSQDRLLRFGVICVIAVMAVICVIFVKAARACVRWKHGVAICIAYGLFVLAVKTMMFVLIGIEFFYVSSPPLRRGAGRPQCGSA